MPWGGQQQQAGYAGQQGPPTQQPHPTVPYGQDGNWGQAQQQTQPQQQQNVPQQQQQSGQLPWQQPTQSPQPHPTVPYGEQPTQPQTPQQPQGPTRVNLSRDQILDGPDVPPELRGRTVGQAMSIYSALANDWLQRQRQNGANGAQQTQQSAQQPAQQQPAQQQQAAEQRRWDWSNPEESIGRIVEERLEGVVQRLNPVIQDTQARSIAAAQATARHQIPDYAALEHGIMEKVTGFSPEALQNPQVWINAARLVRGELMERGEYRPQQRGPNQGGGQQQPAQQPYQVGTSVPAQPYQFFTENPTPPHLNELGGGTLSEAQRAVARAMGMTDEQYIHWSGGIQR